MRCVGPWSGWSGWSCTGAGVAKALVFAVALLAAPAHASAAEPAATAARPQRAAQLPDPGEARSWLDGLDESREMQRWLDGALEAISRRDPRFARSGLRVSVIDLASTKPRIAHHRGDDAVYPASVVKFVYLMAAYAWQERGLLQVDPSLDAELSAMIRESSNQATRKVFARLTGTEPGPELAPADYDEFRRRRLAVKRWLEEMGIRRLHTVNPTYDGGGDLFGRDLQFLRDRSVTGGLPARGGELANRQSMTANDTARLLALLATDRALTAADSRRVCERMKRDPREQPHLAHRIAGGASKVSGTEVFAKSGTWGPIYADAGIVRHASGRQFVLAVFTEASPPYRGDGIAELARLAAEHFFASVPVS